MRPTERFSSRADNYARFRPGYPPAAIALLEAHCGLRPGAAVADVGSGTGILTALLLARGAQVFAIEPNDAMRAAADRALGAEPRFVSVKATAEATTLAAASVDLLVAGQAFHWFDVPRARAEAVRVVRPGGAAALLWNERPREASAFLEEYEGLLLRHAADYAAIKERRANEADMRAFLGGSLEVARFANGQRLDFAGLEGRLMSSSYAPEPGHPQHAPMLTGLRALFARHARDGHIEFPYQTLVYFGPLRS